jgi:polar amino acid transport system substrate-binding protein
MLSLAGSATLLGLTACSSSSGSGSSGSEAATTEAADQLEPEAGMDFIVGFDQDYPPYGYVGDDGEYTGFDLDLAQRVCEINDWNYQPNPINWDAKDGELNGGSITCIWNGFTVEGREDDYTFSEPYMNNAQVVVVKADSGIESFDDLAGKAVITQADSAALDVLEGDQADLAATFGSWSSRAARWMPWHATSRSPPTRSRPTPTSTSSSTRSSPASTTRSASRRATPTSPTR